MKNYMSNYAPHFRPVADRPVPEEMTTSQLVEEFAHGKFHASNMAEHNRHGKVVFELRVRHILD